MTANDAVAVASNGYPPGAVRPLFVSQHDEYAAVLLETGSGGWSYPYFVLCERVNGQWEEKASSNMGGWYQLADDNGVVVYWGETEVLDEPIEVSFKGQRWPTEISDGVFWAVWWDELNPGDLIEPRWPEVAASIS